MTSVFPLFICKPEYEENTSIVHINFSNNSLLPSKKETCVAYVLTVFKVHVLHRIALMPIIGIIMAVSSLAKINKGDEGFPCLTPRWMRTHYENVPLFITLYFIWEYNALIHEIISSLKLKDFNSFSINDHSKMSNAISKSTSNKIPVVVAYWNSARCKLKASCLQ